MNELVELNRYLHDFTAAMWTCGAVAVWLLCRAARRSQAAARELARVAVRLQWVTIPSLAVTLVSGGVRAAAYTGYEYQGPITGAVVTILVAKHAVFVAVVAWGVWVHVAARRLAREGDAAEPGAGGEV
ncbi:MAG: hypothetical protein ACYTFI_18640 [Planctomycetota bacterium]